MNPLARHPLWLSQFEDGSGTPLEGGRLLTLDPSFGVPGRPQSATNQSALFTGQPAPALLGRHLLGFPNAFLRELLQTHSIVKRLSAAGRSATFANGYPVAYLDALKLPRREGAPEGALPSRLAARLRPSASTLAMSSGGVALRTAQDIRAGEALTADVDGRSARARFLRVPERTPREAAEIFVSLARAHDFTLFEHYLADEAGHLRDFALAEEALRTFDAFAREVVALGAPAGLTVLVCSDHGNVEDLSTRNHTLNRVPVLAFGPGAAQLPPLADLAALGNAVVQLAGGAGTP